MKGILGYLLDYYKFADKKVFFGVSALMTILVFLNYYFDLHLILYSSKEFLPRFAGFFFLFAFTFTLAYLINFSAGNKPLPKNAIFYLLLILGPAIFAVKIALLVSLDQVLFINYPWNRYLEIILQWPVKGIITILLAGSLWVIFGYGKPIAGLNAGNFNARPYFLLLAAMIPLLVLAGLTEDFQQSYPKLKNIDFIYFYKSSPWLEKLIFELSYGADFLTIEFFFRGFLILAFIRFAGKDAILPMAAFYCAIHFGKPLAECISSYFGGIILGAIVYHTRSIWGGLIVHLGIAWLMELTGYLRI